MPPETYGGLVGYGQQVPTAPPDYVDSHRLASEEKIAWARLYWTQREPSDFEMYGTTGRRVVEIATGEVYTTVESDPTQMEDPSESGITCFTVNGGWIFYLRPMGVQEAATAGAVGLHAATVAGVLENSGNTLRDVETGERRNWNKRKAGFE